MRTIQRETPMADGTFSTFTDDDGSRICDFLEPPTPFPAGRYVVKPYLGSKHPYAVPCYQNIPGHTVIEQHPGNDELDTADCQLPGSDRGKLVIGARALDAVLHSRETFVALMHRYGFTDYALDATGAITTTLTTPAALAAWILAHPACAEWTIDVLDAVPAAA